jgi:uncharacterized membrane protein
LIILPFTIDLIQNIGLTIMQAKHLYGYRAKVYLLIAVINVALAIPLGLKYGGIGCAIATGLSMIIGNGFIGITIMALVSFFFVLYAINNTQATDTDSLKKGLKVYAYNKERAAATTISSCTPEPNQTCMPIQRLESVNTSGITRTPLPTFAYKDSKEPLNQSNSTKAQTSASGTDNNNNSSCNIAVNGNNNQIIQNSNVFFNIEK